MGQGESPEKIGDPPLRPILRLEEAAIRNLEVARLMIGLFEAANGQKRLQLFPGYTFTLQHIRHFPKKLRPDAEAICAWALSTPWGYSRTVDEAKERIEAAVIKIRGDSALGKRRRREAARLMRLYPAFKVPKRDSKEYPENRAARRFDLLPEEISQPLSEQAVMLLQALAPGKVQVLPHDAQRECSWIRGAASIRLNPDRYSIAEITYSGTGKEPADIHGLRQFEGDLIDYFATGTEGVMWAIQDDRREGYGGLVMIDEGDHLTIFDAFGAAVWRGFIHCDRKAGMRSDPRSRPMGQPCALGHWVHWTQKGFKPDAWAEYFIRPQWDRFRGVLVRKAKIQKSKSGPAHGQGW